MPLYKWDGKLLVVQNKLAVAEACCCGEEPFPCSWCSDGVGPPYLQVDLGLLVGAGTCDAFENQSYILTRSANCYWRCVGIGCPRIAASYGWYSSGQLRFEWWSYPTNDPATWLLDDVTDDCSSWSDLDLPYVGRIGDDTGRCWGVEDDPDYNVRITAVTS
jgi:hypothetical protein